MFQSSSGRLTSMSPSPPPPPPTIADIHHDHNMGAYKLSIYIWKALFTVLHVPSCNIHVTATVPNSLLTLTLTSNNNFSLQLQAI